MPARARRVYELLGRHAVEQLTWRHRTTSQLTVKPPDSLRGRMVVDPKVLSDRVERPTPPTHLSRLGSDALVHRRRHGNPELDLDP